MEQWLGQLVNIWHTLQDKIQTHLPSACQEAAEKIHFSRHGHGQGDHEMASFRSFDRPEGAGGPSQGYSEFGEVDECDTEKMNGMIHGEFGEGGKPGAKISEWQAGWNVTNAIQVIIIFKTTIHIKLYCI